MQEKTSVKKHEEFVVEIRKNMKNKEDVKELQKLLEEKFEELFGDIDDD